MTCPGCGCLRPRNEPERRCDICRHDGCGGCIGTEDGICMTCRDIERKRYT